MLMVDAGHERTSLGDLAPGPRGSPMPVPWVLGLRVPGLYRRLRKHACPELAVGRGVVRGRRSSDHPDDPTGAARSQRRSAWADRRGVGATAVVGCTRLTRRRRSLFRILSPEVRAASETPRTTASAARLFVRQPHAEAEARSCARHVPVSSWRRNAALAKASRGTSWPQPC